MLGLGGFPWRGPQERAHDALVRSLLAGALVTYALLEAMSVARARWSLPVLLTALVLVQLGARRWAGGERVTVGRALPGIGAAVGIVAFLVLAFFALRCDAVGADFWAHWGVKAFRFAERGAIDFEFLRRPSSRFFLPEYPRLWSDLMALPSWLAGRADARGALLFSLAAFGMMLVRVRGILRSGARGPASELCFAAIALATTRFALTSPVAGLPDALIALSLVAATPALLDPELPGGGARVALAAAAAAATKAEGSVLGLLLLVAFVGSRLRRPTLGAALGLTAPWAAAVASWALPAWLLGLGGDGLVVAGFDPARAPEAIRRMSEVATSRPDLVPWTLAFLALPALIWRPRTRAFGAVVTLQLLATIVFYASGRIPVATWIDTSFHRLVMQLLPALLCVLGLELLRAANGGAATAAGSASAAPESGPAGSSG